MSTELYRELKWLPRAPGDLTERVRGLDPLSPSLASDLRTLATHSLDVNGLTRLARFVSRARSTGRTLEPLTPLRIGLIGHGTLDLLAPALIATGLRHGFLLDVTVGKYDQLLQSVLSPDSPVVAAQPDLILLSLDWRALPLTAAPGDAEGGAVAIERAVAFIDQTREAIAANCKATAIVPTVAPPAESVFGSLERALPGTRRWLIDGFNREMGRRVATSTDILLDVAAIAETVGLAEWHDHHQWNLAKLPFAEAFIPLYADHVCRTLAALRGRSRRVLVLDLDNTVWGGVIGDDGLGGIVLAQGDATGEAHLAVQRMALDLRSRGIVLAVCSKNTDEVAREVFRSHPEMLLREQHIAVFQANWNDKATNLRSIASELSLGLDSLVFLDDNPVERGLVRTQLPQVAVPEIGTDPAEYSRTLAAAGYFDLIAFSEEDRKRAEFYDMNARRATLRAQTGDIQSYLASLQMEITFAPFDATGRARIVQLINKSNQFNLTTRRYTAADVERLEADPQSLTLQVRLTDIYGDNGMISVVICRAAGQTTWEIDTWLMSCRVLGRGVEQMVLREILDAARAAGVTTLIGRYIPTERNALVKDHYSNLGFKPVSATSEETVWSLDTTTHIEPAPMTIGRTGGEQDVQVREAQAPTHA
ncbi:MAG TPA: HAD-IIIC family phosphatase [Steroidobacteraceae bacterium]|jgi:FkbH-like protein